MAIEKLIFFTIFVYVTVSCDAAVIKQRSASRLFMNLNANATRNCQFINHDFHKLEGLWLYVLRTVTSKKEPMISCGTLEVKDISQDGFQSVIKYKTETDVLIQKEMTGLFISETIVGVPQLDSLVTGDQGNIIPHIVQVGLCDNDTILVIEPVLYRGGEMVFTRFVPDDVNSLKLRFGTFDVLAGKEYTQKISYNCQSDD